ncbi:bis(5'-nucleosyl)-tetraphosphatase (symmetrical) YqeK [Vagococcus humatus]|uniref:bis(5'-nucleosyl)-tetraphosphatase (symmetrical) n=1 Tax=Vagococcus humatus TaxID=1889241 RepID=A0A429Z8K4_9ENTE|nr:bis(5'-nucleosyl)-tetraphosphatase (symmetrical) YqeK [Vagococcus humatus]RST90021.1 HD domain-containing protein [Vagococcus humatus]
MVNDYRKLTTKEYEQERKRLLPLIQKEMSDKRFNHVLRVEEMAIQLAKVHDVSPVQASLAALIHDYAKERPDEEMIHYIKTHGLDQSLISFGNPIWHGILGACLAKEELSVTDPMVLQAVRLHTTGAKEMTDLDQVIYVADYVELGRQFEGVEEARELAFKDLKQAVAYETKHTLLYLIQKEVSIYPKTLETYNQWVVKK